MILIYLTLAWGFGIWLAHLLWVLGIVNCGTPAWPFGAAAGSVAGVWLIAPRIHLSRAPGKEAGRGVRFPLALLVFLLLGAWRYSTYPFATCPTPADLAFYNGDNQQTIRATVEGVVTSYPDERDMRTFYRVQAEKLTIGNVTHPVRGDILVQTTRFPEYAYGDRLLATGQLEAPPLLDDFDYRAYLARQGIHSLLRQAQVERTARGEGGRFWSVLSGLRSRGADLLNRILPEPAASLLVGMTLGIESSIPPAVSEAYKATGTTHVIVISGSNISLLAGVLLALFGRLLGKRRAPLPAAVGIMLYVLLVGANAAALRAGIMGVLYVFAIALGRQSTARVSLLASGLLMTVINPLTLWDASFQLSFMATLGLIQFTQPLEARLTKFLQRRLQTERVKQVTGVLNDTLIVTLAAQITTLPLIIYYFGRLSVVSMLTNFLILPAQAPIMIGGMATLVTGLLCEPLGRVIAIIPWLFLTYTTTVVRLTAAIPFASVETGGLGRIVALVYYLVLCGTVAVRRLEAGKWLGLPWRKLGAGGLGVVAALWLGMTAVNSLPDGRLHIFFVPGEAGEAALIVTPGGRRAWIWDGRGDGAALATATRPLLTGWRSGVDVVIGPPTADGRPEAAKVIDPAHLAPGVVIRLDDRVTLTRLAAGDDWAFAVSYDGFRTILPATLSPTAQTVLLKSGSAPATTLLKAAGPGTGAWPAASFLAAAAPQTLLWPQDTTYPPDVAKLLTQRGALRVPSDAIIEIVTDGQQLWLHQRSNEQSQ